MFTCVKFCNSQRGTDRMVCTYRVVCSTIQNAFNDSAPVSFYVDKISIWTKYGDVWVDCHNSDGWFLGNMDNLCFEIDDKRVSWCLFSLYLWLNCQQRIYTFIFVWVSTMSYSWNLICIFVVFYCILWTSSFCIVSLYRTCVNRENKTLPMKHIYICLWMFSCTSMSLILVLRTKYQVSWYNKYLYSLINRLICRSIDRLVGYLPLYIMANIQLSSYCTEFYVSIKFLNSF